MPPGEVSVRAGWPRRVPSSSAACEPPCSSTSCSPPATRFAISSSRPSPTTPAPPPIFTTRVMLCLLSSDRVQAGEGQPQRLVPAATTIERLHGIAGRALHEIVERGQHHHAPLFRVELETDIAVVA